MNCPMELIRIGLGCIVFYVREKVKRTLHLIATIFICCDMTSILLRMHVLVFSQTDK